MADSEVGHGPNNLQPPLIQENDYYTPGIGIDPAKYLLKPGTVKSPGDHSAGLWAHARPYISNGDNIFIFPVGAEGFSDSGQATLELHKYIGDDNSDGITVHYGEDKITLSGTFPGLTSVHNKINCKAMLKSVPRGRGLLLWVPGVFPQEQIVLPESWSFDHQADDRTHSIEYTITFAKIGGRGGVKDPQGPPPPPQPGGGGPKGKPGHVFIVTASCRTLRAIAKKVYGDTDAWVVLVKKNQGQLNKWKKHHPEVPAYKIPTYRWPLGTKFSY